MPRRRGLLGEHVLSKRRIVYGLCIIISLSVFMYSILLLASDNVYPKPVMEEKPFDKPLYKVSRETSMEYGQKKDKDDLVRSDAVGGGTEAKGDDNDDGNDNDDDDSDDDDIVDYRDEAITTAPIARTMANDDDNEANSDAYDDHDEVNNDEDFRLLKEPLFSSADGTKFEGTKPDNTSSNNLYITIDSKGNLGNQMFQYAALYCLTKMNHAWTPYLKGKKSYRYIKKFFGQRLSIGELSFSPTDERVINLRTSSNADALLRALAPLPIARNVTIRGYFQSYKFFDRCRNDIREQFSFPDAWKRSIVKNLEQITPAGLRNTTYVRVGIHVRRTTMIIDEKLELGYVPPPVSYYEHAIEHFSASHDRVLFVVTSDDLPWCRQHLSADYMVFVGGSVANDFATLSLCDHLITSLGTYSWWAGWLNSGTTVYYGVLPRADSYAGQLYANNSYIPPDDEYNKWTAIV